MTSTLMTQDGVATRNQLVAAGMTRHEICAQLDASRWQPWGSHVVVTHNGALTRRQLMWAAVLDAGYPAALGSHTSLELAGYRPFAREAEQIHLVVERGRRVALTADPRIVVHESRRVRPELHVLGPGPRRTETPRSAIDAAAWQPWPRFACALVASVVQQRICSPDELEHALGYVGRVRHKAYVRLTVRDVRGGSEALGEIDLMALCRRFGLQEPERQVRRRDAQGRNRYLDALWRLPDGRTVVLEIDGAHHLDVAQWQDDLRRERGVVVRGSLVLRATSVEMRLEPGVVAADLIAIGVPRVVSSGDAYSRHHY